MKIEKILSPFYNPRGACPIERITVHCMPGLLTAKACAAIFQRPNRNASSNYCIGKDYGDVVMCVEENCRAWTSGTRATSIATENAKDKYNDYGAITFECASDPTAPFKFPEETYKTLVELTVDIMKRYKRTKLVYIPDKKKAHDYKVKPGEMLLTFHRWFQSVECPGDWFVNHAETFCQDVNGKLSENTNSKFYRVQVGAFIKKENAERMLKNLKEKGFDGFIVEVDK